MTLKNGFARLAGRPAAEERSRAGEWSGRTSWSMTQSQSPGTLWSGVWSGRVPANAVSQPDQYVRREAPPGLAGAQRIRTSEPGGGEGPPARKFEHEQSGQKLRPSTVAAADGRFHRIAPGWRMPQAAALRSQPWQAWLAGTTGLRGNREADGRSTVALEDCLAWRHGRDPEKRRGGIQFPGCCITVPETRVLADVVGGMRAAF